MKKILSLILVAALTFLLAACGGEQSSNMTQEEMEEVAEEMSIDDFQDIQSNEAKANTLIGNVYKVTGFISTVTADYFIMTQGSVETDGVHTLVSTPVVFHVYLPEEILASLPSYGEIIVVGEVTGISSDTYEDIWGAENDRMVVEMKNAYMKEIIEN